MNNIIEIENVIDESDIEELPNQNILIEADKREKELEKTFENVDQSLFIGILILTVIIMMIFEGILNFLKSKKEEQNSDAIKYKKYMRTTLIIYFIYLIFYFLITTYIFKLPTELTVTFIIVSTFLMLTDVFFELPFFKKIKKK